MRDPVAGLSHRRRLVVLNFVSQPTARPVGQLVVQLDVYPHLVIRSLDLSLCCRHFHGHTIKDFLHLTCLFSVKGRHYLLNVSAETENWCRRSRNHMSLVWSVDMFSSPSTVNRCHKCEAEATRHA